jgi:hypothetical protein
MAREKTVAMTLSNDEYLALCVLRTNGDGHISTMSQVLRDIVIPIIMNGHRPEIVSPDDNETISIDDSQNVTEDDKMSKQLNPFDDIKW